MDINKSALDRSITGHDGDDQFNDCPDIRDEILDFADVMERLMHNKDAERGDSWKGADFGYLRDRLWQEFCEASALGAHPDEWADVANFAMMLRWHVTHPRTP